MDDSVPSYFLFLQRNCFLSIDIKDPQNEERQSRYFVKSIWRVSWELTKNFFPHSHIFNYFFHYMKCTPLDDRSWSHKKQIVQTCRRSLDAKHCRKGSVHEYLASRPKETHVLLSRLRSRGPDLKIRRYSRLEFCIGVTHTPLFWVVFPCTVPKKKKKNGKWEKPNSKTLVSTCNARTRNCEKRLFARKWFLFCLNLCTILHPLSQWTHMSSIPAQGPRMNGPKEVTSTLGAFAWWCMKRSWFRSQTFSIFNCVSNAVQISISHPDSISQLFGHHTGSGMPFPCGELVCMQLII